jgi:hypothetical protein
MVTILLIFSFLVEVMSLPKVTLHQLLMKCDFTSTNISYIRSNVIYLYLVEVKALLPMTLLLNILKHPILSWGIVADLDLVEVMTPPLIVEVKARRSKSASKYWLRTLFMNILHYYSNLVNCTYCRDQMNESKWVNWDRCVFVAPHKTPINTYLTRMLPVPNVIKHFHNMLEHLSPASFSSLV